LQGAALLALPSFQENFGLCAAEALACGVPAIVSPHVNLAGDIEAAGAGWVTGLEPHQIEKTLKCAMNDAGERQRRGEAGREFVWSNFGWPKIAAELVTLYQQVAAGGAEVVTLAPSFS